MLTRLTRWPYLSPECGIDFRSEFYIQFLGGDYVLQKKKKRQKKHLIAATMNDAFHVNERSALDSASNPMSTNPSYAHKVSCPYHIRMT